MKILPRRMFRSAVDTAGRAKSIADRLADGRLPKAKPVSSRAGYGSRRLCDGCGGLILAPEVEQEHEVPGGVTLRFHATCAHIWERLITSG